MKKLSFVYLLEAGERNFSSHIHTTWEMPFSASLYIMLTHSFLRACTQDPRGGLVDKPGKSRDFYHTCYALSGLSVAQHSPGEEEEEPILVGGEVNLLVSKISVVEVTFVGGHPKSVTVY